MNIISGSAGANGGIPGAGIYETIEVAIMMMMMIMMDCDNDDGDDDDDGDEGDDDYNVMVGMIFLLKSYG